MIFDVARLELRQALRQPLFWWISLAYFAFALAYISTDIVGQALASAAVDVNSSWAITRMVTHLSYIGLLGAAAFVGHSVIRDFRGGMAELLFTIHMTRREYVLGRLLGGTLAAVIAFSAVFIGLIIGHMVPWADPDRLADFPLLGFLLAYLVFALPNVVIGACLLFSLALVSRDLLRTWTGAVAIFLGFFVSRAFAGAFYATEQGQTLAALVEPFATYAATAVALEWTVHDRNLMVLGYQGLILMNRALWLFLAGAAVTLAYLFFRNQPVQTVPRQRVRHDFLHPELRRILTLSRFEWTRILRGAPFRIMLGLSLVVLWIWVSQYGRAYGTGFYPYTADMVAHIHTVLRIPLIAIITFYAAELIWGASLHRFSAIIDSSPARSHVLLLSRYFALVISIMVFLACATLVTLGHQFIRGFTDIEPAIYLVYLGLYLLPYFAVMAAFALLFQVLVGNRYTGMLAMALLFLTTEVSGALGLTNNLLIPGARLELNYTPLAGFGHYLESVVWFHGYWLAIAGLALLVAAGLYPRGETGSLRERAKTSLRSLTGPAQRVSMLLLVTVLGLGSWIYWHTQLLDPVPSEHEAATLAAGYEQAYGQYREDRRPKLTSVEGELALFPETRHFQFSGLLTLENPWDRPLETIMLTAPAGARLVEAEFVNGDEPEKTHDETFGVVTFQTPLMPG